jgi:hypothetical protein
MIKAKFDMGELRRSVNKAAKRFGETNRTAVSRWGVSTARELAFVTQPFGNGGTKKKQQDAIKAGMNAVCRPVDARTFKRSSGGLNSPEEIDQWVDEHRGRNGHARLGGDRKAICRKADFNKALRARKTRAGMAKGSWIGAGQRIARRQRGAKRINIGKNYMGWAQKHADKGTATQTGRFRAIANLISKARHTRSSYVLKKSKIKGAVQKGGRNTLRWYKRAAKKALDK